MCVVKGNAATEGRQQSAADNQMELVAQTNEFYTHEVHIHTHTHGYIIVPVFVSARMRESVCFMLPHRK